MFSLHRAAVSLIAIGAAVMAGPVAAQTAAPVQDRQGAAAADERDVIVTAQQAQKQVVSSGNVGVLGAQDALSTPFNVTTYTAQLILDQQAETIGKVMENDPSVRTTYGSGNQSELFVIRGFPVFGDDISIDGLYGVTPRQLVSPELFEGVQVLNGASAFLFGAAPGGSGVGGSINLTPKRAQRRLFRATANYMQNGVFGGNFDAGSRFGADGALGLRVNGVYRSGNDAIHDEHRKVIASSVDVDFRHGPGRIFVDFGYEYQAQNWSRPEVRLGSGVAVPAVPDTRYNYGQPWTFTQLRDIYALARIEVDVAKDVTLYAGGGIRDGAEHGDYSTLTITNGATGAATAARLYVPREDNNESAMGGLRAKFRTGPLSHQFNLGASINLVQNRNSFASGSFPAAVRSACGAAATAFCTNLYNAPIVAKPADNAQSGSFVILPRVSAGEFKSVFVSDTVGLFDDRVLVTGGVRHQNIVVDGFNRVSLARTAHYDQSADTPVVGLLVKPTDYVSLYANRVEALVQGPIAPTTALNAGQVFAPYRSIQYEAGAKLQVRGLTGTFALYTTDQPNAFTNSSNLYVLDGEQRNRGIELSLNGEPTSWLRIIGGFTLSDAKLVRTLNNINNGKTAIGVPGHQVNLSAELAVPPVHGLTLTGRFVNTGGQWVDAANTQRLSSWSRVDLGARYVFVAGSHPLTARVSAENIDNRRYWYSAFGGYLVQGSPRTVKASLTFEY